MLDEYLRLGGIEIANGPRAYAYGRCLPCCVGLLKDAGCDGVHDATNPYDDAVWEWVRQSINMVPDPRGVNTGSQWGADGATLSQNVGAPGVAATVTNATVRVGPRFAYTPGAQYTVTLTVESSASTNAYSLFVRPARGSSSRQVALGSLSLAADVPQTVTYTFIAPATAASATSGIFLSATSGTLGAVVKITETIVVAGERPAAYFDGVNLPAGSDPDASRVGWTGAADASPSFYEVHQVTIPARSLEPAYDCSVIDRAPWYDPNNPVSSRLAGFYPLSVKGITDSTMTASATEGIEDGGVIGVQRHSTRAVRIRSMIIGCGNDAAEYGLAWLKASLGENACGRHGDACGTTDLEFFIACPPALHGDEDNYSSILSPFRRYLHGVSCTSGPVIAEEFETVSGAYVITVEYILTAESPFVWGETIPITNTGSVLTAYSDIPYNLIRHPSAEQSDGVAAVIATQFAFNGSAEYGATGWGHAETGISSGITAGVSTDIAAVGPSSYRSRLLATGAVVDGTMDVYYNVSLAAVPAGSKPSVSLWAAALIFSGAPTIGSLVGQIEWRTASATISTQTIGNIPANGGNVSANGLTIPATATVARIHVRATDVDAVSADDLRLYVDAFSLTVP